MRGASPRMTVDLADQLATIRPCADALQHFDGERYRLIAWAIMPNDVHALIEQIDGFPLADIVHSWKSFTAKQSWMARTSPIGADQRRNRQSLGCLAPLQAGHPVNPGVAG